MEKDKIGKSRLECSCGMVFKGDDTLTELFVQLLTVIRHLKGPSHGMKNPRYIYNHSHSNRVTNVSKTQVPSL